MSKVAIVRTESYGAENVRKSLSKLLELVGGWESFLTKGDKVLLKPNLLSARKPEKGVTTNPVVVTEIALSLLEFGVKPSIGDSPGGAHKGVQRVLNNTGMTKVSEELGIPIVNFEIMGAHKFISNGYELKITKALDEFDHIINIPRMKTHGLMTYTGAIKNMFGVVPGFAKSDYHKRYPGSRAFAGIICEIFENAKPSITIMDAINGMEGEGPSSGEIRHDTQMMIFSDNAIALDYIAERIIGLKKHSPILREMKKRGNVEPENIELLGGKEEEFILKTPFKLPPSTKVAHLIPGFLGKLASKLIWIRPELNSELCVSCNMCKKMCPADAIKMTANKDSKVVPVFDYEKCILCLCCHEICPEKAIFLKRSRLARGI